MKEKIAIALSGGIDSLVAAHMLKEQGFDVFGIHFITGFEASDHSGKNKEDATPSPPDPDLCNRMPAGQIAAQLSKQLGIRVEIVDVRKAFHTRVVDYFVRTYQDGKTPNPCLVCNPAIKFGTVFAVAKKHGAARLATGHYARIQRDAAGRDHLFRGADHKKDQSYFLAFMTRQHLARACFPLGEMTKQAVIAQAAEKGIRAVISAESQDVCFIKSGTYGEFLASQEGFVSMPGAIENTSGQVIGTHEGLHLFTIGQRRGINCPATEPYYVIDIDRNRNVLVVGFKSELLSSQCRVVNINWIHSAPAEPICVDTRVRYRHKAAPSTLFPSGQNTAMIKFDGPQEAVTPGQGAVFYQGDGVLGGGWIERG